MPHGLDIDPVNHRRHKERMETRAPRTGLFSMRHLAGMVLVCALLLRGMIPGGYMPNFDVGDGQGFLVICSSIGEQVIPSDDENQAPADTLQDGLCAFAMLGTWSPLLLFVLLLVTLPPRQLRQVVLRSLTSSPQWLCRPPAARGPPLVA